MSSTNTTGSNVSVHLTQGVDEEAVDEYGAFTKIKCDIIYLDNNATECGASKTSLFDLAFRTNISLECVTLEKLSDIQLAPIVLQLASTPDNRESDIMSAQSQQNYVRLDFRFSRYVHESADGYFSLPSCVSSA